MPKGVAEYGRVTSCPSARNYKAASFFIAALFFECPICHSEDSALLSEESAFAEEAGPSRLLGMTVRRQVPRVAPDDTYAAAFLINSPFRYSPSGKLSATG